MKRQSLFFFKTCIMSHHFLDTISFYPHSIILSLISYITASFIYSLLSSNIQKVKSLSRVQLFVTPWTVADQAPPSMGFPGKSTGVGCHFLLQGDLPDPGIKPASSASPTMAGGFFATAPPGKPKQLKKS